MKLTHLATTLAATATITYAAPLSSNDLEARAAAPIPAAIALLPEKRDAAPEAVAVPSPAE